MEHAHVSNVVGSIHDAGATVIQHKKKVLHLTYDMRIGGTEQVIKNIVQGMKGGEFEHSILCIEKPIGPFGDMLIEEGINIDAFQRKDGFDIPLIKQIRHYIRLHNIDILHCHQYTPWVYGCLASVFTNTKVIFTEHGRFYPDSSSWKRKFINPVLTALTNKITAISKATADALAEFEYIPRHNVDVIYNGIAELVPDETKVAELRVSLAIPETAVILGTVARLDPIKNQTMMIKAFHQLLKEHPNSYLLIVGDGEERETLETVIQTLNISQNVLMTGYVAKPVNHLALMDVFLLPSLSEGTSMTILEAMSLGKPTAATAVGGTPEIINQEQSGLLTDNDSLQGFTQSLTTLVKHADIRGQYGQQAKRDYTSNFTVNTMCQIYASLYSTLGPMKKQP